MMPLAWAWGPIVLVQVLVLLQLLLHLASPQWPLAKWVHPADTITLRSLAVAPWRAGPSGLSSLQLPLHRGWRAAPQAHRDIWRAAPQAHHGFRRTRKLLAARRSDSWR